MVKVYFDLPIEQIVSTSKYFNNSYTEEWLDDWAKRVIKEVDKSEMIASGIVMSPVLGPITIREISSGSKALIMMNSDNTVISNANSCGSNCAKLLAELSIKKDFSIYLSYPMKFGDNKFKMLIADTNTVCNDAKSYEKEYLRWKRSIVY